MSLIQEALNKAHNRPTTPPENKSLQVKQVNLDAIRSLGAFDRDIEQEILKSKNKTRAKKKQNLSVVFLGSAIFLVLMLITFLIFQNQSSKIDAKRGEARLFSKIEDFLGYNKATNFQSGPSGKYFLAGIAWDELDPYTVINGQILRVGERVKGQALIQSIQRDSVMLNDKGKILHLYLKR